MFRFQLGLLGHDEARFGTIRKYIFGVRLIAATAKIHRYSIPIAAAKDDPCCNTIFELLLPAASAMSIARNIDPMAPRSGGSFFFFLPSIIYPRGIFLRVNRLFSISQTLAASTNYLLRSP